jgi:predicted DNA-binding protein YlxM (UPF0122 family)
MRLLSRLSPQARLQEVMPQRETMEVVRDRVHLLADRDRVLLTMYLENGNSFSQIARFTGLGRSTVTRRIHRIVERLRDDTYLLCVRQRGRFNELELAILKDYFVHGLSLQRIARDRKLCYYRPRATVRKARRLAAAAARTRDPPPPAS